VQIGKQQAFAFVARISRRQPAGDLAGRRRHELVPQPA
jgi:hypothetical protein